MTMDGLEYRVWCEGFPAESSALRRQRWQCLRYCNPLVGTVVGTFSMPVLRVKTLDLLSLDRGGVLRRYSLGGVVAELWFLSVSFRCHWWQVFFCTFLDIFDLLCKRLSLSLCIDLTV
jgi:hypothetical protein